MAILQVEHIVRDKVDAYEDECDFWKSDHAIAMLYFDIQSLVDDGIKLFEDICRLDENWRKDVLSGTLQYDEDFEEKLMSLMKRFYRASLFISQKLLPVIEQHHPVQNRTKFLEVFGEARAMVTPDSEVFCHEKLEQARDAALLEHSQGQTVEYDLT